MPEYSPHNYKIPKLARPVYIGIDPAFRKSGFGMCIIDEANTVSFRTFRTFLDFLGWVFSEDAPELAVVCIENSNLDGKMYAYHRAKGGQELAAAAMSVGKNQAASQYTADACRYRWPETTFDISPKDKGKKWDAETFKAAARQNGHAVGRCSQDERDAYQLALRGKTLFSFKQARIKI